MIKTNKNLLWIILLLQLFACSSTGVGFIAGGGIDGTGLGSGSISSFGSIFVNDIEYDTDNAEIFINGEVGSIEQLKLGMYVDVFGPQDVATATGTAKRVEYRDILRGPIKYINEDASFIRLLGLGVRLSDKTQIYGVESAQALKVGDVIRISSSALTAAPSSDVEVSFLEYLPQAPEQRLVIGALVNLDTRAKTFFIGGQRFTYTQASHLPTTLENHMLVEVLARTNPTPGALLVDEIKEVVPTPLAANSFVQIDGRITRYQSIDDFDVQYRPARLSASLTASLEKPLKEGIVVYITGYSNDEGIIIIDSLKTSDIPPPLQDMNQSMLRTAGPLLHINAPNKINIFGVNGLLTDNTVYIDVGGNQNYGFADLRTGAYHGMSGKFNPAGEFEIWALHRLVFSPPERRQLQGPFAVIDSANQQLQVLGVDVISAAETTYFDVSALNDFKLSPPGPPLLAPKETEINAAAFFNQLKALPNHILFATGKGEGGTLVAKELILLPFKIPLKP